MLFENTYKILNRGLRMRRCTDRTSRVRDGVSTREGGPPEEEAAGPDLVQNEAAGEEGRLRVLITEDDAALAEALQFSLTQGGYAVDWVANGARADEALKNDVFGLLILDLGLPKLDGFEVLRRLRKRNTSLPVLILSGREKPEEKVMGLDLGADDYLVKPFEPIELVARVGSVIRRYQLARQAPDASVVQVGDARLALGSLTYSSAATERVILTPTESRLLEYLMRHQGRVMSRTLITEYAWDYHFDPGTNIVDVVINRLGLPAGVFRNDAPAPRVAVRLVGRRPNTQGIGAKIRLLGGAVPVQEKEVASGGLYLSSADPSLTFAAGNAGELTLEVAWRDGRRTLVTGVQPNRQYEIREDSTPPVPKAIPRFAEPAAPHFTDVSSVLRHVHVDQPFDDWERQALLPHSLSRLGPGLAWYDADADGDEDLIVGTGRGGKPAYFRNDAGKLTRLELPLPPSALDRSGVLGLPDRNGRPVVLMGQANYEARALTDALAAPGVVRLRFAPGGGGTGETGVVPGDTATTGPLALADYDGDGDLDLFVGGRVIPTAYPFPATSRLFRNQDGQFQPDLWPTRSSMLSTL